MAKYFLCYIRKLILRYVNVGDQSFSDRFFFVIKPEYVREVEMGPFKHTVDDGLDLRKAVFECMYTLLDSCLDKVEIFEYLNNVELGLKDTYDIKMLTYLILIRLSDLCPSAILQRKSFVKTL